MTWNEFKEKVESQGVEDDAILAEIDLDGLGCSEVYVWFDKEFCTVKIEAL